MKMPFHSNLPAFDASAINQTIQRALESAGLDTRTGPLRSVTDTIRRALSPATAPSAAPPSGASDPVIDVEARVLADTDNPVDADLARQAGVPASGSFQTCHFSHQAGTRGYKLYVPAKQAEGPRPMVVMLHGCTQSAQDFATGTRMNALAEAHGFLVVYPEQTAQANPSRCWNWFSQQDQQRDLGEPALIAGIVREVAARHGADHRRIFIAGLSAGAAMAVILGETYPELFSAIGVHSGLPYSSAQDIPSAMAAMKGGRGLSGMPNRSPADRPTRRRAAHAVPSIVFHGDRDHTVQQSNGAEIIRQAEAAYLAQPDAKPLVRHTREGRSAGGRAYTRTLLADEAGRTQVESWVLHGAGHAWSGGDAAGSYTDGSGPDASAEMVRFFLASPRAGSA